VLSSLTFKISVCIFVKKKSAGVANQRPSAAWDKILGGTIEFPLQKLGVMERGMGHRPGQQRSSRVRTAQVRNQGIGERSGDHRALKCHFSANCSSANYQPEPRLEYQAQSRLSAIVFKFSYRQTDAETHTCTSIKCVI